MIGQLHGFASWPIVATAGLASGTLPRPALPFRWSVNLISQWSN
jgi:hypothetical protein